MSLVAAGRQRFSSVGFPSMSASTTSSRCSHSMATCSIATKPTRVMPTPKRCSSRSRHRSRRSSEYLVCLIATGFHGTHLLRFNRRGWTRLNWLLVSCLFNYPLHLFLHVSYCVMFILFFLFLDLVVFQKLASDTICFYLVRLFGTFINQARC